MNRLLGPIGRFLRDERGAVYTTEVILWTSILVISIGIGIATLRLVTARFFLAEVAGIASLSNLYVFDTMSPFYTEQSTPNFDVIYANLGDQEIVPQPGGASGAENP